MTAVTHSSPAAAVDFTAADWQRRAVDCAAELDAANTRAAYWERRALAAEQSAAYLSAALRHQSQPWRYSS